VKYAKIHRSTQNGCSPAIFLIETERRNLVLKQFLNKTWLRWQAMAPDLIPLPCVLAFPPPSHRDATTPSPCWAPHFMTQERIMFSNPTPSKPRLSPAVTMSDDTPSALTPSLHCASSCSLQPLLKLSLLSLKPSLLQFASIVSPLLNHGNTIFEPVRVFYLFLFCLCFSDKNELQL